MSRHERPDPMTYAPNEPLARRAFLQRMGAAIALFAAGGCTRPPAEEIVPFATQPRDVTPGRPRRYASSFVLDGYATGVVVETHEGRPTKIEGNAAHPASLGATGILEQASVLSLYDPDRARGPRLRRASTSSAQVTSALLGAARAKPDGEGLVVVLPTSTSPTLARLLEALRVRLPGAQVFFHGTHGGAVHEGARIALGRPLERRHDLTRADVVLSLDDDFLAGGVAGSRLAHDFASRRSPSAADGMNRLYVVEPALTATGTMADHRLAVRCHDVALVAAALLRELAPQRTDLVPATLAEAASPFRPWVAALARDLRARGGGQRTAVLVGARQPPVVHALAHAIDHALGNVGTTTVRAASPVLAAGGASHDVAALAAVLASGKVHTLAILGTNLVHASPGGLELAARVRSVPTSFYLGAYDDETASVCTMTMPEAHWLESWGDARAFDGTVSLVQPVVTPFHGGKTVIEVIASLVAAPGEAPPSGYALVRETLGAASGAPSFEAQWRRALRRGTTDEPTLPAVDVPDVDAAAIRGGLDALPRLAPGTLELAMSLDEHVHDGRFANNAWLLELPTTVTKLTWTNAATLSAKTASRLGVADGDEVELDASGRRGRAVVQVAPGHADDSVSLTLGWGRAGSERNARDRGTNAYALAADRAPAAMALTLRRTGARRTLAVAQRHHELGERAHAIARRTTRGELAAREGVRKKPALLPLYDHAKAGERQWGMAIDLALCTGCSACVVACQAENNVPTVGEEDVAKGRIMHWLRVDAYVGDDAHGQHLTSQPMLCQHCEKAPCEYVCPVNATVHSEDGLNQMVYNRCVGTRFCSNNCPYKVRRFNWFDYHQHETDLEQLAHNPDVTVRERGVMEKCTFCVQRIRENEIAVHRGDHDVPPVRTACQAACPTGAIVFGDLRARGSEVARLHADPRAYGALEELGTKPRVVYLERVTNPNPELA